MKYFVVKTNNGTYIRSFNTFEEAQMFKINKCDESLRIEEVILKFDKNKK